MGGDLPTRGAPAWQVEALVSSRVSSQIIDNSRRRIDEGLECMEGRGTLTHSNDRESILSRHSWSLTYVPAGMNLLHVALVLGGSWRPEPMRPRRTEATRAYNSAASSRDEHTPYPLRSRKNSLILLPRPESTTSVIQGKHDDSCNMTKLYMSQR